MSWNPPGQKPGKPLPGQAPARPRAPGAAADREREAGAAGTGDEKGFNSGDQPGNGSDRAGGGGHGGHEAGGPPGSGNGNGRSGGSDSAWGDKSSGKNADKSGDSTTKSRDQDAKGRKPPVTPGYRPDPRANAPRRYGSEQRRDDQDPDDSRFPAGLDDFLRRLNVVLGPGPGTTRLVALVLLAAAFTYGGLGFHQVKEGERALVLRQGRLHAVQGPGQHWNPPLIDTWRSVNVGAVREAALSTEVISHDEDLAAVTLVLRYRIADPVAWALRFDDADAELLHAAEAALQAAAARLDIAELHGPGQRQWTDAVQREVAAHLRRRDSGLALVGVSLERVTTPPALDDVVAAVARARADIATTVQEARARGEAELKAAQDAARARVAAAEAARDAALQRAQLDAVRLRAAIDAARRDPAGTRQRLYEETVADVLARTPTVIVGEQGLDALAIPAEKLRTPSPLPPSPATGRAP